MNTHRSIRIALVLTFVAFATGCDDDGGTNEPVDTQTSVAPDGTEGDAAGDATTEPVDTGSNDDTGGATSPDGTSPTDVIGDADVPLVEPNGPCDFAALSADPNADLAAGEYAVGEFRIALDDDGNPVITHTSDPAKPVFEGARDSKGLVWAGEVELTVEELQGSFEIDRNTTLRCERPRWDGLVHRGDMLVLRGVLTSQSECSTHPLEVRMCQTADRQLALEVDPGGENFGFTVLRGHKSRSDRIFGMGEQFPHDDLNLNGREIPAIAQEGGVGRGHIPITPTVNAASPGSGGSEDSTYYAAPHILTSTLQSLFLENTEVSVFDFTRDEVAEFQVYSPLLRARILAGDSPLDLIERFTEYAGRFPELPEWVHDGAVLGLARPLDETRQIVADLEAEGTAIAAIWNQTWSGVSTTFIGEQVLWNWIQNPNDHPDWNAFVADMNAADKKVLCYINPMFRDVPEDAGELRRNLYQEGVDAGHFVTDEAGEVLLLPVTAFDVALLDLTDEAARTWMKAVIRDEMLDRAGCSGWMADFAEALPFEAHLESGVEASTYHNQYPVDWIALNREALEEAGVRDQTLVFNRSGFTTSPRHAMLLWQGDQLTTWDKYDGLVSAMRGLISGGFSGISLNHSDVGGYTSLSRWGLGYSRESEQLKRWTEMNAFTVAMRTHEGNQPGENAQIYSDAEAMQHFARMTRVYRSLAFYRKGLVAEAAQRGWPVVRHLWMHYPEVSEALDQNDAFLLGSEILVAPIKNKCFVGSCDYDKEVWLPPGEWIHVWSGTVYGDANAGQTVTVQAPIGEPAVFIRSGSTIVGQWAQNLDAEGIAHGL